MLKRIAALFVLTLYVVSSFALTSGPTQPEYSGFKPANTNGMVDLMTGDLSYTIPLMEVSGPGFSLPLTLGYTSGVQVEQAASWVGLGWSLSPGAINRQMNRYPDDYWKGRSNSVLEGDEVVTGWDVALHFSVCNIGVGVNFGKRSDQGSHYGMDVQGIGAVWNERDGFDIPYRDYSTFEFAMMAGQKFVHYMGMDLIRSQPGMKNYKGIGASFNSTSLNSGAFHRNVTSIGIPLVILSATVTNEKAWLYKNEDDELYGYLNLSEMEKEEDEHENSDLMCPYSAYRPPSCNGTPIPCECSPANPCEESWDTEKEKMEYTYVPAMGIEEQIGVAGSFYETLTEPIAFPMSTPDCFMVKAEGVSSSFRAYRQDIGDYFGMDRQECPVPEWVTWVKSQWWSFFVELFGDLNELEEKIKNNLNAIPGEYATGFADESSTAYGTQSPVVQFREAGAPGGAFISENWREVWDSNDDVFENLPSDHLKGLWCNTVRRRKDFSTPQTPSSLEDIIPDYEHPFLPTWNESTGNVEWVEWDGTHSHLEDKTSRGTGIYPLFREDVYGTYNGSTAPEIPAKALIGFTVVRPDGMVYEFHQPVFNYYSRVTAYQDLDWEEDRDKRQYNAYDFGSTHSFTSMERAYAYSWLITAIKTPDYFDDNNNGEVDFGDWGSWVSFKYEERIPQYIYRTPYEGMAPTGTGTDIEFSNRVYNSFGQASWGVKEIYYLTDVYTPTHHAKFTLSDRDDGREADVQEEDPEVDTYDFGTDIMTVKNTRTLRRNDDVAGKVTIKLLVNYGDDANPDFRDVYYTADVTGVVNGITMNAGDDRNEKDGNTFHNSVEITGVAIPHSVTYDDDELDPPVTVQYADYVDWTLEYLKVTDKADPVKMKKLDCIELFARDITNPDNDLTPGNPLKKVIFSYARYAGDVSDELSPGIPNHFRSASPPCGKLTLRTVTVGDGENFLPPYEFSYYKEGDEAPYNPLCWDRWGYYKHDGGLIPVNIGRKNIAKWDKLLDTIQAVGPDPADFSYWGSVLRDTLQLLLSSSDYNTLLSCTGPEQLKGKHEEAIGEALDRMVHDLQFFKRHQDADATVEAQLQAAVTTDADRYPAVKAIWDTLIWNTSQEGVPGYERPVMDISGNLLDIDGNSQYPPTDFSRFDSNAVHLFNLGIISQFAYIDLDRTAFTGDDKVENEHRCIMAFLDVARFDHETVPEDVVAWSLKTVKLPSGGDMTFVYESDDYSFVGRTRMADHLESFNTDINNAVADISNTSYFRRFGTEKDLMSSNNILRVEGWKEGLSNIEKITKYGNKDTNDVRFRVTTLFRIYRNISDDPANPDWQLNEDFEKLRDWKEDAAGNDPPAQQRLHLLAMFNPRQFVWDALINPNLMECGTEVNASVGSGPQEMKIISPIPIDCGPVITEDDKGFVFPSEAEMNAEPDTAAKYACQRGYVEFDFAKLRAFENFEYKIIQDCGACRVQNGNNLRRTIQVPEQSNQGWTDPVHAPLYYNLKWGRKVDFSDYNDFQLQRKWWGVYYSSIYTPPPSYSSFYDYCLDGAANGCYKEGTPEVYKGYYAWNYLQEYSSRNSDLVYDGNAMNFNANYWDYYSANTFIKNDYPELAGHAAGIAGGGVRVKKVVYKTGWPQERGAPSNAKVLEYAYVCEAQDGQEGSLSSGATPSMPPPFNNKGDDRPDVPPQVEFLRGEPGVKYGTVYEKRKGRGRIIYNFLTCADISDFIVDDTANYWKVEDGNRVPINGAYDAEWDRSAMKNHRYRLHKCSHLQGLPINLKKYSEDNRLVESKKYTYLTSLTKNEICNIDLLGRVNDVNSRAPQVLLSQDDLELFAGDCAGDRKLLRHHLSRYLGQATERFRMKWINRMPMTLGNSIDISDFTRYFDQGHSFHDLIGHIEMEVLEHSVRQYSSTDLQYAGYNPEYGKGVGTRTVNSYFDFYTGVPLITTVMEATVDDNSGCNCVGETPYAEDTPGATTDVIEPLTTVTIPQYWNSDDFKEKNMFEQPYSVNHYEGLGPLVCRRDGTCDADDVMEDYRDLLKPESGHDHVLRSRVWTEWNGISSPRQYSDFKKSEEKHFTADLAVDPATKRIKLDLTASRLAAVGYPFDQPDAGTGLVITDKSYLQYGESGQPLEEKNADNTFTASFYSLHNRGLDKVGVVLNARLNDCAVLTVDETFGEAGDTPYEWPAAFTASSGEINTTYARSGRKSLDLSTGCIVLATAANTEEKDALLSFWVRSPADLSVAGVPLNADRYAVTYEPTGTEWQRMWVEVDRSSAHTITIGGSSGQIDDVRFAGTGAHVYSMTYDSRGDITSLDDPNDNIWYYDHDAFGNLVQIRDKQKIAVSTQSKVEGKR